jgi:hypothetical protein
MRSRRRTQNQGRGGAGMAMRSLVLGIVGRNSDEATASKYKVD